MIVRLLLTAVPAALSGFVGGLIARSRRKKQVVTLTFTGPVQLLIAQRTVRGANTENMALRPGGSLRVKTRRSNVVIYAREPTVGDHSIEQGDT